MRLDLFLYQRGDFSSRHQATIAIKNGAVSINKKVVMKPAFKVSPTDQIDYVKPLNPFVSQGGLKLQHAIEHFDLCLENNVVLDIGASTGGFSDCALSYGAQHVYAVDVGSNQLHPTLKAHEKVTVMEQTNFLDLSNKDFPTIDFISCDVSFVSSLKILSHIKEHFDNIEVLMLIKPQFETKKTPKSGVIKDPLLHEEVLKDYLEDVTMLGFTISGLEPSPIKGQSGNIEFLLHLGETPCDIHIKKVVKKAQAIR